jgi:hypothetical protein
MSFPAERKIVLPPTKLLLSADDPVADAWHEEGGGPALPAWSVTLRYESYNTTFWFSSLPAAQDFVATLRQHIR